jgi:hypothetical protein
LAGTLLPGGSLVMLVPNVPSIYGSLDRSLGQRRRYDRAGMTTLVGQLGFTLESVNSFNKVALIPWWAYSKLFRAGNISKLVLKIFDKSVWFLRRLDVLMPWPGLSLLVVARKPGTAEATVEGVRERETVRDAG